MSVTLFNAKGTEGNNIYRNLCHYGPSILVDMLVCGYLCRHNTRDRRCLWGKGKGEFRKEETFLVNACNLVCFFLSMWMSY